MENRSEKNYVHTHAAYALTGTKVKEGAGWANILGGPDDSEKQKCPHLKNFVKISKIVVKFVKAAQNLILTKNLRGAGSLAEHLGPPLLEYGGRSTWLAVLYGVSIILQYFHCLRTAFQADQLAFTNHFGCDRGSSSNEKNTVLGVESNAFKHTYDVYYFPCFKTNNNI